MPDDRLPTHVWVSAGLRRCNRENVPAVVRHSGEKMGGTVLLKLDQFDAGCRLFNQMRDLDGKLSWVPAHQAEFIDQAAAEAQITRAIARDPDLWVIEIETRDGIHPFGAGLE